MKKKYLIIILTLLILSSQVFADVVTTTRRIEKTKTPNEQKTIPQRTPTTIPSRQQKPQNNLSNNIKMCKPYSETMKADYMGMNMSYKLSIDGWVNNKCRLNFTAQTNEASSSFQNLYGVNSSDATILSFAPKIRCEFTKQQLEYVGDSILQEQERNNGARNNMLKNPNNIDISSNISQSDQRLLDVVLNQSACTILNSNDLNKMMQELMQY